MLSYLIASALGFATAENIEYVFMTGKTSPIPGTSVATGQFLVLLVRWLAPVHVICSVLQAVNLSYSVMRIQRFSLLWILFPAIVLHGTFDFSMFMAGVVSVVFDYDSTSVLIWTAILAAVIVITSTIIACKQFRRVAVLFSYQLISGDVPSDEILSFEHDIVEDL